MSIFSLLSLLLTSSHVLGGQIYGGHEAKAHSRPFMALVERTLANRTVEYCAGFLVSEWFVMTAAHCQASWYRVYLGLHDMRRPEGAQNISVDRAFPDIDYNNKTLTHDIMLLKLTSKAKTDSKVQVIDLADPKDDPPEVCMVFGWGRFRAKSQLLSPVLKETTVMLTRQAECERESFYCSSGKSGPGEGDSGCPLVCENGKVFGVLSSGTDPDQDGVRSYRYAMISKNIMFF